MKFNDKFKGWFHLKYDFDASIKVALAFERFLGRKHQGYVKIYAPKGRAKDRGFIFYVAIEGKDYYDMLLELYPNLTSGFAPSKEEVSRFLGYQFERDWMFGHEATLDIDSDLTSKRLSRKSRYLFAELRSSI